MTIALVLIEGDSTLKKESLNISLANAKQIVIGNAPQFGWILHVAANSPDDLRKALLDFSKIHGVKAVTLLQVKNV